MPHFRRKVATVLQSSLRQAPHVAPTHHESEMKRVRVEPRRPAFALEGGDQMIDAGEEELLQPSQFGGMDVLILVRDRRDVGRAGAGLVGSMGFAARPDGEAVEGRAGAERRADARILRCVYRFDVDSAPTSCAEPALAGSGLPPAPAAGRGLLATGLLERSA